jgi:hypothetical protein
MATKYYALVYAYTKSLLDPKLSEHGGDHKSEEYQVDNVNLKAIGGNSEPYTIRRLKRDRPELAEKVLNGELSANAAAIEAGFRKKTVTVTLEPRSISRTLTRHLSRDEINDLLVELAEGVIT